MNFRERNFEDCTGVVSIGKTSADGRLKMGQTHDRFPSSIFGFWGVTRSLKIVQNKETGIKVLGDLRTHPDRFDAWLNSEGVARFSNNRYPIREASGESSYSFGDSQEFYSLEFAYISKDFPSLDQPDSTSATNVLLKASTAKEAIEIMGKTLPHESKDLFGPLTSGTFSCANAFISPKLKHLESMPKGYNRRIRAEKLLEKRKWGNAYSPFVLGRITTPYLFRILRDRNNTSPDLTYEDDTRGAISLFSFERRTVFGEINEIDPANPDMLSICWATPNFPPTSPFIPFFTGLEEIPPSFGESSENKTNVFQELLNAITFDLEVIPNIQSFWESFEYKTLCELKYLREQIEDLVDGGDRKSARERLYQFSNEKCEKSIEYAEKLIQWVKNNLIINGVETSVKKPKPDLDG